MIDKIISMAENELSKKVIVPLFQKIYSTRVEFSGGGIEKGRDIIVYKKDELGDNEYIGIQVKKQKLTPNSSIDSFQQLLNQLSQMKNEGVVDPSSGEKTLFKKRIFITPYPISDKTYDSHQGAYQQIIKDGVKIIDGNELISLLSKYMPALAREIVGDTTYIGDVINSELSNKILMKALNLNNTRQLCDIYCETSLVAGNKNNNAPGFIKTFKHYANDIDIKLVEYPVIRQHHYKLRDILDVGLFNDIDFLHFETSYNSNLELDNSILKIANEIKKIDAEIYSIVSKSSFSNIYPTAGSMDFINFIKHDFTLLNIMENKNLFLREVLFIDTLIDKKDSLTKENSIKRGLKSSIPSTFKIKLNSAKVVSSLDAIIEKMKLYASINAVNIKDYLSLSSKIEQCHIILNIYNKFFSHEETPIPTLNISISDAFDTGINIVVLGEAGSGKTTNLQYHAKKLYNNHSSDGLVIYMTLNELAELSIGEDSNSIILGIKRFLHKIGLNTYSEHQIKNMLTAKRNKIILDSVDEAISQYGWVISKLKDFSLEYPKCQIITSSRYTVTEISDLGFSCISLLPFNKEQKIAFFEKWFINSPDKATSIINHLNENSELDKIVTNPLSATIMAVLQENKIPLPKSEASLYKKRFELLSGHFDKFKGINRMTTQPDTLLSAARLLAFKMHENKKRSVSKDNVIAFLHRKLVTESQETSIGYAEEIVKELISPSEILLLNNDGGLSFGHLRFQEFLASEQLVHMRKLKLKDMLLDSWWNDVFILYSQHAYDIGWIIDYSCSEGCTLKVYKLLKSMVNNSSMTNSRTAELLNRLEISFSDEMNNDVDSIQYRYEFLDI